MRSVRWHHRPPPLRTALQPENERVIFAQVRCTQDTYACMYFHQHIFSSVQNITITGAKTQPGFKFIITNIRLQAELLNDLKCPSDLICCLLIVRDQTQRVKYYTERRSFITVYTTAGFMAQTQVEIPLDIILVQRKVSEGRVCLHQKRAPKPTWFPLGKKPSCFTGSLRWESSTDSGQWGHNLPKRAIFPEREDCCYVRSITPALIENTLLPLPPHGSTAIHALGLVLT